MPSQANDTGWILHSLAQSRRFGPMTEDELRGYFRAGMVKSVDRLSAPGETELHSAAEVAAMLGVAAPVGPPPPEASAPPPPPPAFAAAAREPMSEDRAAKAAAAMNIDIAALMATNAPASRRSSWLVPVIAVAVLVLMLFVALRMLRNLKPSAPPPSARADIGAPPSAPVLDGIPRQVPDTTDAATTTGARTIPAGAAGSVVDLQVRAVQAQKLQNAGDWSGLSAYANEWLQAQPDSSEALLLLGMAESKLGNHAQAIAAVQKVLVRDPGNADTQSQLADAYQQAERFTEAAQLYGKLVAVSANDARLWNNYGAALSASGQQAQAVAALETAVRLDPAFKQAWTNLGNVYQSMGDTARASAAFANAR